MKAFIYTGGSIYKENITEAPSEGDLVIAADSGYLSALELSALPQILVGDFDSLGEDSIPSDIEIIRLPAEKDLTDTQIATEIAVKKGATEVIIIGGLDGRLDHALSNMSILESLFAKRIRAIITDGRNRVRYISSSSDIIFKSNFKYLSLIAADKTVKGVDLEGCKYPLRRATLSRDNQFAVSNEIKGNCAFVSARRGGMYIIESNDKV